MKKTFSFVGITFFIIGLMYVCGPKVSIDFSIDEITLADDLDKWLAKKESAYSDLVTGTEKRIVWANNAGGRTAKVFVYLHGFSASRQETAPLLENAATELGANIFETRLTGHGRSAQAMTEASVNAWLNDAVEALTIAEQLGDEVNIVGVSTGGTLAWWLAAYAPERVDNLILISPNFKTRAGGGEMLAGPWGKQLAMLLIGEERSFKPQNAGHAQYWTERYPTEALLPMFGLLKLVDGISAEEITQPVLAIYSADDKVVDAQFTKKKLSQLPVAQLTTVNITAADDPNNHVIAGDILSPSTTAEVANIINGFARKPK